VKILIADDDPVSRRLMERTLQKCGYEVVTAEDGTKALAVLAGENAPRLALLDWMMPGIDGLEICRAVRAQKGRPYVYITLLTSKLSDNDVVAGLEAGSDDYLTKPCNPEELKARLRTGQRILNLEDTLVEAREEMRFKATHDPLTGLWNHGAILSLLESELKASARDRIPAAVLLCDLDHFKQVNDTYGHLTGDEILRQVAERLSESARSPCMVGRYGGEEFLIVMKGCGCEHLVASAERVRESISSAPFPIVRGSLSLSISLGAVAVEFWKVAVPIEPLLKQVDAALYLAKSTGRNRVVYAELSRTECL
jgi:diguanylate cyclase (GGDEF)-like protein